MSPPPKLGKVGHAPHISQGAPMSTRTSRIARFAAFGASIALAFSFAGATSANATTTDAAWTSPTNVSVDGNNGVGNGAVLATAPNGDVFAAWMHGISGDYSIQAAVSHDGGLTWGAPATLSDPLGHAEVPRIATNGSSAALVYWNSSVSDVWQVQFARTTDGGATWSNHFALSDTSMASQVGSIVGVGDHGFVAAFNQHNGSFWDIVTRSTPTDGQTWSAIHRISDGANNSFQPVAATDEAGVVAVEWNVTNGLDYDIYSTSSTDGGLTWDSPTGVVVGQTISFESFLMPAPGGGFTLVWSRDDGAWKTLCSKLSSADGSTWGASVDMVSGVLGGTYVGAASADGIAVVAYIVDDGTTTSILVTHSTDGLVTGSTPQTLASTPSVGSPAYWVPAVSVSAAGNIAVAWWKLTGNMNYEGNTVQVSHSTDKGQTWSTIFEPAVVPAINPQVTYGADHIVLSWTYLTASDHPVQVSATYTPELPNTGLDGKSLGGIALVCGLAVACGLLLKKWGRLRESNSRPIHYE